MKMATQIGIMMRIYAECFSKAFTLSKRYLWVMLTVYGYGFVYLFAGFVLAPYGIVGGILYGVIVDALFSSFLVMVESMVKNERIRREDFKRSFWVYFWDVMGVLFVYGLVRWFVLGPLAHQGYGWAVLGIQFALFIFFNPMPELIYKERVRTLELFQRAYQFIVANWPEWFVPNILVAAMIYAFLSLPLPSFMDYIVKGLFMAFAIYFFMIFRGLLFDALYRSSRRMRIFHYQATRGTP